MLRSNRYHGFCNWEISFLNSYLLMMFSYESSIYNHEIPFYGSASLSIFISALCLSLFLSLLFFNFLVFIDLDFGRKWVIFPPKMIMYKPCEEHMAFPSNI